MARPPAPINGAPAPAKSASTRSPPAPLVSLGKVANSSKTSNGNSKNAGTFYFPDSNDTITTSSSTSLLLLLLLLLHTFMITEKSTFVH